jgi:putative ABC transport system substrate-binding protein
MLDVLYSEGDPETYVLPLAAAAAAGAQQRPTAIARVGVHLFGTRHADPNLAAFQLGLRELGYVEGRSLAFDYRFAEGKPERLPGLAADLVRLGPALIVALGGEVAPAAQQATATIPIVVLTSADPVRGGLVASLSHPGGNVTGVTLLATDLAAKRAQLLSEIAPRLSRVAFLRNPDHADDELEETQRAAAPLGWELIPLEVRRLEDFDAAFATAVTERAEALIAVASSLTLLGAGRISEFAASNRLPLVSGWRPWVKTGAVLTYGPSLGDGARRAGVYVDKILNGAKPADLPVEQPMKFELVINLKTAQALGLTIPPTLLFRANEVLR